MALEEVGLRAVIEGTDQYASDAKRIQQAEQGIATQSEQTAAATKRSAFSFTELKSAMSIAADGLRAVEQAYRAVIVPTVAYAKEVRDLSRTIGASAEESSKLIQAADDVNVSVSSLEAGLKAAIRKGIRPTIEGLGELADKYVAIEDPIARAKFLMDTFGRSGADLAPLMEKGKDGIKALGDEATRLGLVMSEQDVQAARQFEIATDNLDDALTGLKYSIGNALIPVLTEEANRINDSTAYFRAWTAVVKQGIMTLPEMIDWQKKHIKVQADVAEATKYFTGLLEAQRKTYLDSLGPMDNWTITLQHQAAAVDEEAQAAADLAAKLAETHAQQLLSAGISGDLSKAQEAHAQALANITAQYDLNKNGIISAREATDAYKLAVDGANVSLAGLTAQFIYNQAAADLDAAAALAVGRALGVIDEQSYAAATAIANQRALFDAGKISAEDYANRVGMLNGAINSLQSRSVTLTVETIERTFHEDVFRNALNTVRQHGGAVWPGQAFTVNEAGTESMLGLQSGILSILRGSQLTPREPGIVIPAPQTRDLVSPALIAAGGRSGGAVSNSQSVNVGPNYISSPMTQAQFNQRLRQALGA